MSVQDIVKQVTEDVDGALGCAAVALDTGLMLGVYHAIPYFTQAYIDAVGAAAVDMFRGNTVQTVEKLLAAQRGSEFHNSIQEIQMTTDGTYHFMGIVPDKPNVLMVLITSKKANLGMGWASLRAAMKSIVPHCP